jgi:nucleoside-diphosphate-sugar epimerase
MMRIVVTILGAGGAIGNELVKELSARSEPVRLVGRNPKLVPGAAEAVAADLSNLDDTLKAISGSRVAFLVVGLKYDSRERECGRPDAQRNRSLQALQCQLVFFDNVYVRKSDAAMTEETPFHPCSKKGEIRAQIATTLLNEIKAGNLTALIARAADFHGPRVKTAIPNVLVFDKFVKGAKAMWLANDSVKHSFTFTPDAARSLVLLADSENA